AGEDSASFVRARLSAALTAPTVEPVSSAISSSCVPVLRRRRIQGYVLANSHAGLRICRAASAGVAAGFNAWRVVREEDKTASRQKKTSGSTTNSTLRLRASPRPKWAIAADTSVIAKPAYANSFTLNGTVGITSARTPRILATVSSTLKYGGNPRWTKAPSGPLGKGKWSVKTKLTMLNSITASTSPVLVRDTAPSPLV